MILISDQTNRLAGVKILKFILLVIFVVGDVWAQPLVIAHRGASHISPEETEPSYLMAGLLQSDFLEADVQRTKDGVLIAYHDVILNRTTNVKDEFPMRRMSPVGSFTWDELQKLDAGTWFNKKNKSQARASFAGLKILTLSQVLDLMERFPKAGLYLETKLPQNYPGIESEIVELLKSRGWIGDDGLPTKPLVFESFQQASLEEFTKLVPEVPRTFLLTTFKFYEWKEGIQFAKKNGASLGIPQWTFYLPPVLKKFLKSNLALHPWTLDKLGSLKKARSIGTEAVFTNRPEIAVPLYRHEITNPPLEDLFQSIGY